MAPKSNKGNKAAEKAKLAQKQKVRHRCDWHARSLPLLEALFVLAGTCCCQELFSTSAPPHPTFLSVGNKKLTLKDGIQVAEDKTFGLKNKNKSAKVQQ